VDRRNSPNALSAPTRARLINDDTGEVPFRTTPDGLLSGWNRRP
jgi:hypothetical protein